MGPRQPARNMNCQLPRSAIEMTLVSGLLVLVPQGGKCAALQGRRRCGTGKFETRKSVEPGGKMGRIQRENGSGYTIGRPGTVRRNARILAC